MKRALKITVVGAALAGAAVGTVAFLRSRGSKDAELVDYDEPTSPLSDAPAAPVDVPVSTEAAADA